MPDRVVLSVPARGEFARTVRLTASSLAARVGLSFEDVEDVRLATEEAFVFVTDHAPDGANVDVVFVLGDCELGVEVGPVESSALDEEALDRADYARFILEAVCDELDFGPQSGECKVRLVKRARSEAQGA